MVDLLQHGSVSHTVSLTNHISTLGTEKLWIVFPIEQQREILHMTTSISHTLQYLWQKKINNLTHLLSLVPMPTSCLSLIFDLVSKVVRHHWHLWPQDVFPSKLFAGKTAISSKVSSFMELSACSLICLDGRTQWDIKASRVSIYFSVCWLVIRPCPPVPCHLHTPGHPALESYNSLTRWTRTFLASLFDSWRLNIGRWDGEKHIFGVRKNLRTNEVVTIPR